MKVAQFLRDHNIQFETIPHPESYTAREFTDAVNVERGQLVKTVLLRADHGFRHIVVVFPADKHLNLRQISRALGGSKIEIASEECLAQFCPDCERGVLPPLGSQYGLKTIMDSELLQADEIIFEGNTHHEAIRVKTVDFQRVEEPLIIDIAADNRLLN